VIGSVHLEVVIRRCGEEGEDDVESARIGDSTKCPCEPNGYTLTTEARGANLKGTTNPVTVTLSIGNNTGTTHINAELE
jgi:hypothetical protein